MVLLTSRGDRDRGAVAVLTALLMVAFLLMAGLVIDLGYGKDVRRQSQNAADAAALAGVNALFPASRTCTGATASPCFDDAVTAARGYASRNFGTQAADWAGCSATSLGYVPTGGSTCISFDSPGAPTKVKVVMPTRVLPVLFASVSGTTTMRVSSLAVAQVGQDIRCTLCFLGSVDAGNGDFSVSGGAIAVNGNVSAGPNSNWTSNSNGVVGTVNGGVFAPPATKVSGFTDPLASLVLPFSTTGLTAKSNPCTGGPGIYAGAVSISGSCPLAPGLYVVQSTWTLGNKATVSGAGVTLYAQAANGYLNFKNGDATISAPTSGPYKGLAIVYDRTNTNSLGLQGNGSTSLTGGVYIPNSSLDFNGNSCFGFSQGPIVASSVVKANGNQSCVRITDALDQTVTHALQHLSQ